MEPNTIAIGIGLAVGIAGLGVGIGQGLAANGGLSGMSRQPEAGKQIQNAMLLALVFLELVFLLTFVLGFLMSGKIPAPKKEEKTAMSINVNSQPKLAANIDGNTYIIRS
jgi:F-type H+-transporting ATPase subunit c